MTTRPHLTDAAGTLAGTLGLTLATVMDLLTHGWMYVSDLDGDRWERAA